VAGLNDLLVIRRANNGQVDDASMPIEMREWFKKVYRQPTEPITTEPITTEPITTEPITTEPITTEQPINIDEYGETEDAIIADQIHQLEEQEKRSDLADTRVTKDDLEKTAAPPSNIYSYKPLQLYNAISKYEWEGREPIFDFVRISRKDRGKLTSSAFGPAQIVGNTVRHAMTKMNEGTEQYNFANRLQSAQNLFINLANKYKAGKNFNEQTARETARTDSGKPALKILGITEDQFIDYVKDGYFLPSNQKNSKGIPIELLGDNYEKNYINLFNIVLQDKLKRKGVESIGTLLESYHGSTEKSQNQKYREGVLNILNNSKKSGGMVERNYYDYAPRNI
jgi:hypothetical protein